MHKFLIALAASTLPVVWPAVADEPKQSDGKEVVKAVEKWEYATITTSGRVNVLLVTGAEEVAAESWSDLAEKVKVKANGRAYQIAVLDHLGGQGWELVSHAISTSDNRTHSHYYTFKRRK